MKSDDHILYLSSHEYLGEIPEDHQILRENFTTPQAGCRDELPSLISSMQTFVAPGRVGIRLLTPEEVASILSVDKRTVLGWARDGKLERVKISGKMVLFTPQSIICFVKSKTQSVKSITAPNPKGQARVEKSITRKGGGSNSSRKSSWRSLREEVAWR